MLGDSQAGNSLTRRASQSPSSLRAFALAVHSAWNALTQVLHGSLSQLRPGSTLMSIFSEGFSPDSMEKGHSPSIVTFISSPCFIFPSHIPFLLLAVVYLLGAFTRARVLRLEKCLGRLRSAEVTSLNTKHGTSNIIPP